MPHGVPDSELECSSRSLDNAEQAGPRQAGFAMSKARLLPTVLRQAHFLPLAHVAHYLKHPSPRSMWNDLILLIFNFGKPQGVFALHAYTSSPRFVLDSHNWSSYTTNKSGSPAPGCQDPRFTVTTKPSSLSSASDWTSSAVFRWERRCSGWGPCHLITQVCGNI
jgi:hypothetical protein